MTYIRVSGCQQWFRHVYAFLLLHRLDIKTHQHFKCITYPLLKSYLKEQNTNHATLAGLPHLRHVFQVVQTQITVAYCRTLPTLHLGTFGDISFRLLKL